jgi:hypothetical protein
MNFFYFGDIIVNFMSAFYESDLKIIDDHKVTFKLFHQITFYRVLQFIMVKAGFC